MTKTYMTKPETEGRTVSVSLESWGWSSQGTVREENQDAFLNWPQNLLWAVADGVGGTKDGALASQLLISMLMQTKRPQNLQQHIEQVTNRLSETNEHMYFMPKETAQGATTVISLLMAENNAACLWAGDSRCYLFRNDTLYQCTKDHTLRQEKIDNGELTAPEAARMVKSNIITNAIGVHAKMQLDSVTFPVYPGDRFLLCSDGLSRIISPEILSTHLTKDSAKTTVEHIIENLSRLEQPDNITFVVVFVSRGS